ncbi:MAG: LCP family protein [Syntrophomonadaceae bacterium]|nr:LCP family protein [Syntrophomonadaceae bacterium]
MQVNKINYKLVLVGVLVFVITFSIGLLIGKVFNFGLGKETIEEKAAKGKVVSVLVMGIDARNSEENSRSDTMILVNIDRNTRKVAMVWIPRDTRVEVGLNRHDRINSVNYMKGPEAACDVVGKLLNTEVDYYVSLNFNGFAKIVDTLGGVTLDVESNMTHYDPDPKLNINLTKGTKKLSGKEALDYVRYRGGPTADIGRTARQQKFIKAITKETLKAKNIVKLPKIIPEVFEQVSTNIPNNDILFMVKLVAEFNENSVITQTLPGYPFTDPKSGASYWEADKKIAKTVIEDLFAGKTYDVAQDPPNWVKPAPSIYEEPDEDEANEDEDMDTNDENEENTNDEKTDTEGSKEEVINDPITDDTVGGETQAGNPNQTIDNNPSDTNYSSGEGYIP